MPNKKTIGTYNCKCGSINRVFDNAHRELEEKGLHEKGYCYYSHRDIVPLLPTEKAILTVPTIIVYSDFCVDCGNEYVFMIEAVDATVKFTQQGGGGQFSSRN